MGLSSRLRGLHPQVEAAAEDALAWAGFYGIPVQVTSGFRSLAEQARLRRLFLAGKSRFPANTPGDSSHNFGLAFDSTVSSADLSDWTIIRDWIGFRVPRNDVIHAEVPGWRRFV